jgi:hypothetical protein
MMVLSESSPIYVAMSINSPHLVQSKGEQLQCQTCGPGPDVPEFKN